MKNYKQLWIVAPFITTIFGIGALNLLSEDRPDSPTENRTLQQVPGLENIANKDYGTTYETYYTDQFIGRDELLKLYTKQEIKSNKSTVRDHYIIDNEWILPRKRYKYDDETINLAANKLNEYSKQISEKGREVYFVSTPCKSQALEHMYPEYAEQGYALENVSKFGEMLDENHIDFINIDEHFNENFSEEEKETMYFKTDHHWNGVGAFEGFKYIINNMNTINVDSKELLENDNFKRHNINDKNFMGSYNRNLFYIFSQDEDIPYIYSKNSKKYKYFNHDGNDYQPADENSLIATEKDLGNITYAGAYTSDIPLYKIINEDAPIDKNIMIVRDSYQAPTTLLFADLFKSVEILDPRNTIDITPSKAIEQYDPDIVMFMFNSETYEYMVDMIK
ncbi:MAG: alginate O-acetyltransferase AlgX-related protein [Paraclostridium sp.]